MTLPLSTPLQHQTRLANSHYDSSLIPRQSHQFRIFGTRKASSSSPSNPKQVSSACSGDMTKQNVVVPEPVAAISLGAAMDASSPLFPYPPPRAATGCAAVGSAAGGSIARGKKYLPQLDLCAEGVRISTWVESMKASSPTHAKAAAALAAATSSGDAFLDEHSAWMMEHPSALSMFDQIMSRTRGKQIAIFLDYDGTLSPIVDDPDCAFMSEAMRAAVKEVAHRFPTAIVSGRCLDKVYDFVQLPELFYAGSHGMDIRAPSRGHQCKKAQAAKLFQPANEFLPMIEEVYKTLLEKTKLIPGARVENNKFCASVHFRCVDEKKWTALAELVRTVLKEYPKLRLTQGRKVLEIRPAIKWDKGKALEFLLESLGYANCKDVVPVYIGDDRTDEDAFKVLRCRGQGFGILVSKFPKETNASYSLREPSEVMDFLLRLVEWKPPTPFKARPRV